MYQPGRELQPGIWHVADEIDLRWYPGDIFTDWPKREIHVDPQRWPFEAGETPFAYGRRIVAALDADALVVEVDLQAEAKYRSTLRDTKPDVVYETVAIHYRVRRQGKE